MTATIERPATATSDVAPVAPAVPAPDATIDPAPAPAGDATTAATIAPDAAPDAAPAPRTIDPAPAPDAAPEPTAYEAMAIATFARPAGDAAPAPEPAASLLTPPEGAGVARDQRPDEIRLLGHELSWKVTGVLVERATFKARLTEAGLGDFAPAARPDEAAALRRAIAEFAKDRTGIDFATGEGEEDAGDVTRRRKLIREVPRKPGERGLVLALVAESGLEAALTLRYGVAYRFALVPSAAEAGESVLIVSNVARGAIGPDERADREAERQRVEAAIRVAWDKHKDYYTGDQVSKVLKEIVQAWDAVSVESGSGVWYVPREERGAQVDTLERLVRALPMRTGATPAHLRVRETIDWPRTKRALAEAAQDALAQELKDADKRLGEFEKAGADRPGSVKTTTMAGLLDELRAVRNKAELYADTVGMRQGRIAAQVSALGDRAVVLARTQRDARMGKQVAVAPAVVAAPAPVAPAVPVATTDAAPAPDAAPAVDPAPVAGPVTTEATEATTEATTEVPAARPQREQRMTR